MLRRRHFATSPRRWAWHPNPVNNITGMTYTIAAGRHSLAPPITLSQVTARSQATPLSATATEATLNWR